MSTAIERATQNEKRRWWNQNRKEAVVGWLFLAPEAIGIIALAIFPLLFSLILSFTNWNLVGDSKFWKALENNLVIAASLGALPVYGRYRIPGEALRHIERGVFVRAGFPRPEPGGRAGNMPFGFAGIYLF